MSPTKHIASVPAKNTKPQGVHECVGRVLSTRASSGFQFQKLLKLGFYFKPVYQRNLLPETILDRELTYRTDTTCFQEILLS